MTIDPVTAVRPPEEPLAAVPVRPTRPLRPEPALTIPVEPAVWLVVLASAALVRLLDLNLLPLRPDEGLIARAARDFSAGSVTSAWPGDLTAALAALTFRAFGDSDTTARLIPAVLGVAAVGCLSLYRPLIGRGAALIGAALVALSPVAVLSARSLGPEAAALPLALVLPPLAWRVFLDGRHGYLPVLALVVGLGLGAGALVPGVIAVLLLWFAVEFGWLDGRAASPERLSWRSSRRLIALAAGALLSGLLLAATRYGAGFDRLTLAAIRAWDVPGEAVATAQPWRWVPLVLLAYEPLVAALGLAGAVLVLRRWTAPSMAGGRLVVLWTAAGLAITLVWLRHDPAHLLLLTIPLALLAGVATVAAAQRLTARQAPRAAVALLPLVPAVGYTLVRLVGWANFQRIPAGEAASAGVVLLGGVLAAVMLTWLLRAPPAAVLLVVAWTLLGGLTLHAAANAAFNDGSEFLAGERTLPQSAAIVRDAGRVLEPGDAVAVERRVWPALAWPLRDLRVTRFVESPPSRPAVIPVATGDSPLPLPPGAAPVVERWIPSRWDAIGILHWWVFRTPWGPVDVRPARVLP